MCELVSFSQCEYETTVLKQLVYKPEYRKQVLHHASVNYVLFVIAGTTMVHYAVFIHFPYGKVTCMRSILSGVYQQSLKWSYASAWISNDPGKYSIVP